MTETNTLLNPTGVRELVITRIVDAPRELVFGAWTDPRHLTKWWGPKMFTIHVCNVDLRVGGALLIHMRAPDGHVYPMSGAFTEIKEPERLGFTAKAHMVESGEAVMELLTDVRFEDRDGKTKLTLSLSVITAKPEAAGPLSGAEIGWSQSLERLDNLIKDISPSTGREILFTRILNAPRELVFKAWTDPAHIAKWWGPTGFTNTFDKFDFRPGGAWRFTMHGPNGVDYKNEIDFVEIATPERIVLRHINPPHFTITVTLEDLGGKTRLTWRNLFDTVDEFEGVKSFAVDGLRQNIDKLEAHLTAMA
jgi:uncharacterized protein YndB with AHSA1/START domain